LLTRPKIITENGAIVKQTLWETLYLFKSIS
jgi:hypothetical protein